MSSTQPDITEILQKAGLDTQPEFAKALVDVLLDDWKVPNLETKTIKDELLSQQTETTNKLLAELKQKAEELQKSQTLSSSKTPQEQDALLIGLMTSIKTRLDAFQSTDATVNEPVQCIKTLVDNLLAVMNCDPNAGMVAIATMVNTMWASEENSRKSLTSLNVQAAQSPELLVLLKDIQPLISLLSCAQFLLPGSTKVKEAIQIRKKFGVVIADGSRTFVWFHKLSRTLLANIALFEKQQQAQVEQTLSSAETSAPSAVVTDVKSRDQEDKAQLIEVEQASLEVKTEIDPLEEKREKLAAAQTASESLKQQQTSLNTKHSEDLEKVKQQKSALQLNVQELLKNSNQESKVEIETADIDLFGIDGIGGEIIEEEDQKGFSKFAQELKDAKVFLTKDNLLIDLKEIVDRLAASRAKAVAQEKAKLVGLRSQSPESKLDMAGREQKINENIHALKTASYALADLSSAQNRKPMELLLWAKGLDQEKIHKLLTTLEINQADYKECSDFLNNISKQQSQISSQGAWFIAPKFVTTYLVSSETLSTLSLGFVAGASPQAKLESAITEKLSQLESQLRRLAEERNTAEHIATIEKDYSEFMQDINSQIETVATKQLQVLEENHTTKLLALSAQQAEQEKVVAGLATEVATLELEQEKLAREQAQPEVNRALEPTAPQGSRELANPSESTKTAQQASPAKNRIFQWAWGGLKDLASTVSRAVKTAVKKVGDALKEAAENENIDVIMKEQSPKDLPVPSSALNPPVVARKSVAEPKKTPEPAHSKSLLQSAGEMLRTFFRM